MRPCVPFRATNNTNDQWAFTAHESSQDPHEIDLVLVNEDAPVAKSPSRSPFRRTRSFSTTTIRGRPDQKLPSVFEAWEAEHGDADDDDNDFEWDDRLPARPETPAFDTSPTKLFRAAEFTSPSSPCTPALEDLPDIEDESSSDEDVNTVFTPPISSTSYGTHPVLEPRLHFLGTRHFEEWDKSDFVDCHVLLQLVPMNLPGLLSAPPSAPVEILCSTAPTPRPGCSSPPSPWSSVPEHALRWRSDTAPLQLSADPRFHTLVEDNIGVNPSWQRPQNYIKVAGCHIPLDGWARLVSIRIPTSWLRGSTPRTFMLEVIIEEDRGDGTPWPTVRAEMTVANLRWQDVAPRRP
ncbi:hypothetical protein K525DRAFT_258181 [Schizophyllum commune Loenen D]|nr:hypothetical protein K525DRAFT_258181 [Schizophyllum commune Loenen D]